MTETLGEEDMLMVEYPQGQGPNLGDSRLSTSCLLSSHQMILKLF